MFNPKEARPSGRVPYFSHPVSMTPFQLFSLSFSPVIAVGRAWESEIKVVSEACRRLGRRLLFDARLSGEALERAEKVESLSEMGVHYVTVQFTEDKKALGVANRACRGRPIRLIGTPETDDPRASSHLNSIAEILEAAIFHRLAGVILPSLDLKALGAFAVEGFWVLVRAPKQNTEHLCLQWNRGISVSVLEESFEEKDLSSALAFS